MCVCAVQSAVQDQQLCGCSVAASLTVHPVCAGVLACVNVCRTAVHMAARAAGADMMGVLLDALPEGERTELINAADKSGITPVFLAFQR